MIKFAFFFQTLKQGVLNSDNIGALAENIPKGCKYWNLEEILIEDINDSNYTGIGKSELLLKIEEDFYAEKK